MQLKVLYHTELPCDALYMYREHWNTEYLRAPSVEFLHEESLSIQKLSNKGLATGNVPILVGENFTTLDFSNYMYG